METKKLIKQILSKQIIPTKISKSTIAHKFTIEIHTKEPISYISLLYKTEKIRDEEFNILDNETFHLLTFNPYHVDN